MNYLKNKGNTKTSSLPSYLPYFMIDLALQVIYVYHIDDRNISLYPTGHPFPTLLQAYHLGSLKLARQEECLYHEI